MNCSTMYEGWIGSQVPFVRVVDRSACVLATKVDDLRHARRPSSSTGQFWNRVPLALELQRQEGCQKCSFGVAKVSTSSGIYQWHVDVPFVLLWKEVHSHSH